MFCIRNMDFFTRVNWYSMMLSSPLPGRGWCICRSDLGFITTRGNSCMFRTFRGDYHSCPYFGHLESHMWSLLTRYCETWKVTARKALLSTSTVPQHRWFADLFIRQPFAFRRWAAHIGPQATWSGRLIVPSVVSAVWAEARPGHWTTADRVFQRARRWLKCWGDVAVVAHMLGSCFDMVPRKTSSCDLFGSQNWDERKDLIWIGGKPQFI